MEVYTWQPFSGHGAGPGGGVSRFEAVAESRGRGPRHTHIERHVVDEQAAAVGFVGRRKEADGGRGAGEGQEVDGRRLDPTRPGVGRCTEIVVVAAWWSSVDLDAAKVVAAEIARIEDVPIGERGGGRRGVR